MDPMDLGLLMEPAPKNLDAAAPVLTGDDAAALIARLHAVALGKGYERVRMDRGQHPDSKDWYELGYSTGEVAARFSHRRNLLMRHLSDDARREFEIELAYNARAGYREQGR